MKEWEQTVKQNSTMAGVRPTPLSSAQAQDAIKRSDAKTGKGKHKKEEGRKLEERKKGTLKRHLSKNGDQAQACKGESL